MVFRLNNFFLTLFLFSQLKCARFDTFSVIENKLEKFDGIEKLCLLDCIAALQLFRFAIDKSSPLGKHRDILYVLSGVCNI